MASLRGHRIGFFLLTRLLKSAEHGGEIGAENIGEIAAFLHEHGGQAELGDRRADAAEA